MTTDATTRATPPPGAPSATSAHAVDVSRWARHSRYSDPGAHAGLLHGVPPEVHALSAVARGLIGHYRGEAATLPTATREDVNLRWLADQLATDQARHPTPLTEPRAPATRLQGCCRDHSLFCVGVLREHRVPARTRVGFADYFSPGFHHDHVVVEVHDGGRWRRFDPEVGPGFTTAFDPADMPRRAGSPFQPAAEVWLAHRARALDAERYGVDPSLPLKGAWFVRTYVIVEAAHRHGDELLLWDTWGSMGEDPDADAELVDRLARLLVAADAEEDAGGPGPVAAELETLYRSDARLHPGTSVEMLTPLDEDAPPRTVALR